MTSRRSYDIASLSSRLSTPSIEPVSGEMGVANLVYLPRSDVDGALTGVRVLFTKSGSSVRETYVSNHTLIYLLRQARAWQEEGLAATTLSFEIEMAHLTDDSFTSLLLNQLVQDRSRINVELLLTETAALSRFFAAESAVFALAQAGVKFALIGFSLAHGSRLDFSKLPFRTLYVSFSTLFHATSEVESRWLARSVISAVGRHGLAVVAQDVTSAAEQAVLIESGCEYFEGNSLSTVVNRAYVEEMLP